MAQNLYDVLGLSKDASENDVKRAYRKMAQKYHPDTNKGNPDAEQKFKEATAAYEILSDKQKRAQYDQFGDSAFAQGNGGGSYGGFDPNQFSGFGDNIADIFESFFGGSTGGGRGRATQTQTRGSDRGLDMTITFEEAAFGTERSFEVEKVSSCEKCNGLGAQQGSKIITCSRCSGTGEVRAVKNTILGQVTTRRVCDKCQGQGKIPEKECSTCGGIGVVNKMEHLKVKIPAGIDNGATLKLTGKGDAGVRGGVAGDLYVTVRVKAHKDFQRKGSDVYSEQSIDVLQAILGSNVDIQTINGVINMKIPAGTQSGRVFKLSNHGITKLKTDSKGDHYVTITVTIPQKLSKKEKETYMQLASEKGIEVSDDKGFLGKIFE